MLQNQWKHTYLATPYYRISNDDGDLAIQGKGESNSISNQRNLIEDYVKNKPDIILCEERVDDGFSGVNFERPAFQAMLDDVKKGKINCIIVKDLSRFGRNYIEVGRFVQKIFPGLGVRFIAINDHYDSADPKCMEDNILLPFKNLMNDSYSRDLSVKVRSQFEIKRRKGEFIGSFAVYGYEKNPQDRNRLQIDEYAASIVRDIFKWRMSGLSNEKIAERLNERGILSPAEYKKSKGMKYQSGFHTKERSLWSPVAVKRILTNQMYLGHMVQGKKTTPSYKVKKVIEKTPENWVIVRNTHEAILSEEDFETVQKVMQTDTRTSPGRKELYLFSGMLICGDCGEIMVRKLIKGKYPYYMCGNHKNNPHICSSHMINENELYQTVLTTINQHIKTIVNLKQILNMLESLPEIGQETGKIEKQVLKMNEEIVRLQNLKLALYEDLTIGVIEKEEYFELKGIYTKQIAECERKISRMREEQELLSLQKRKENQWIDMFLQHKSLTELSRTILLKLIDQITIFEKSRVKIRFRFQQDYDLAVQAVSLYQTKGEERKNDGQKKP